MPSRPRHQMSTDNPLQGRCRLSTLAFLGLAALCLHSSVAAQISATASSLTHLSPRNGTGAGTLTPQLALNDGQAPRSAAVAAGRDSYRIRQSGRPSPPQVVGASPNSVSGGSAIVELSFRDENGAHDIDIIRFSIAPSVSAAQACAAQVEVAAQKVWISDDAGTGWIGPKPMHEAWKLSNRQCFFGYMFTARADTIQKVEMQVFLRGTFSGAHGIYLWARDFDGQETGWVNAGTFTVYNLNPQVANAAPSAGEGPQREFSFTFVDPNGYDDFSFVRVLVNTSTTPVGGCLLEYNRELDRVRLNDEAGTGWSPWQLTYEGWKLGNSRCRISYVYPVTVGEELRLVVRFSFRPAFLGLKNVYLSAQDRSGVPTGWQPQGKWVVPGAPLLSPPTRAGVFHQGNWLLDVNGNHSWDGLPTDAGFSFQWNGTPVVGDWNGDGRMKAGVFQNGFWRLDFNGNYAWDGAPQDKELTWGWPGAIPVVGDWNGEGRTKIGVYTDGYWFLDFNGNYQWDEGIDKQIPWGWIGATPVVGDWNGSGTTKLGVYSGGFWFLDYNGDYLWQPAGPDKQVGWGWPGATPVVGDWNGDQRAEIGVYSGGFWFLDYDGDFAWNPNGLDKQVGWGWDGVQIVTGDWNGDGRVKIGVVNLGFWFLDYDGNYVWDGGLTDKIAGWGSPGDTPVPGKW